MSALRAGTLRALGQRLALVPPTLLGISLITFLLIHLAPGDPASVRAGDARGVTPELIAEYRVLTGLDRPLVDRYALWLGRSARLDFGLSITDGRPVRTHLAEAIPATAGLTLLAAVIALGLALLLGSWSAARAGRSEERAFAVILAAAYSVPAAVLGLLLIRAGVPLSDAPPGQIPSLRELIAPAVCLALPSLVVLSRHQRGALLSALSADYVRTARAVGASAWRALFRHALRNALLPLVTLAGTLVPSLLSGSVLVERIFGIHGLGMLGYDALLTRDYPTLLALATLGALLTVAGSLFADAGAVLLDPRLRTPVRTPSRAP